jgi:hypothetical protein
VILDCNIIVLQAWRLTGVPMHEWLAVALIGGIVAHLLLLGRIEKSPHSCAFRRPHARELRAESDALR